MVYRRVSPQDRDKIINCYQSNNNYILLAQQLNIREYTARRIVNTFITNGRRQQLPRGGTRKRKLTRQMHQKMMQYVDNNPLITLKEIQRRLAVDFPGINVSEQTISRSLDGSLITIKPIISEDWNRLDIIESRYLYANWLMNQGMLVSRVYVDICAINVWTSRTRTHDVRARRPSVRGERGQLGHNLTICVAVSDQHGLLHATTFFGKITVDKFEDFFNELSEIFKQPFTLIFNNSFCDIITTIGNHWRLPPNSSVLNIAEQAIACLIDEVKLKLTQQENVIAFNNYHSAMNRNLTIQEYRKDYLKRCFDESFDVITQEKCANWFTDSLKYYIPKCINREEIIHCNVKDNYYVLNGNVKTEADQHNSDNVNEHKDCINPVVTMKMFQHTEVPIKTEIQEEIPLELNFDTHSTGLQSSSLSEYSGPQCGGSGTTPPSIHECNDCHKRFDRLVNLLLHRHVHHSPSCGVNSSTIRTDSRRLNANRSRRIVQTEDKSRSSIRQHSSLCIEHPYKCAQCDRTFSQLSALQMHLVEHRAAIRL